MTRKAHAKSKKGALAAHWQVPSIDSVRRKISELQVKFFVHVRLASQPVGKVCETYRALPEHAPPTGIPGIMITSVRLSFDVHKQRIRLSKDS